MKSDNIVREKSYAFAVRIVNMYKMLTADRKEFILSKQALKSGTSIGANIEEALGGISRADFTAKLSIAYKEARETSYWLRLLRDTNFLTQNEYDSIHPDAEELCRIIAAIQKSVKLNR